MSGGNTKSSFLSMSSAYAWLFAFSGLVISIYVFLDIKEKLDRNSGLSAMSTVFLFVYAVVVFASAYHQLKIYLGFHQIETDEDEWNAKTGGWAGSGGERFYRFLILLVILGAFAKGGPVLDLVVLTSKIPCLGWMCWDVPDWVHLLERANGPENKSRIFLALISLTFLMFLIWELLAILAIKKRGNYLESDIDEIKKWIYSDTFAFLIWFSITSVFLLGAPDSLFVIPVLFMVVYIINIYSRYFSKGKKISESAIPASEEKIVTGGS